MYTNEVLVTTADLIEFQNNNRANITGVVSNKVNGDLSKELGEIIVFTIRSTTSQIDWRPLDRMGLAIERYNFSFNDFC